jgi:hypothetical protein
VTRRSAARITYLASRLEQRGELLEQRDELRLQLVAVRDRPLLVAVLREQPVAVELDCRGVHRGIASSTRLCSRCAPRRNVRPHVLRRQRQNVSRRGNEVHSQVRVGSVPRVVHGLPQVGCSHGRSELRPQDLHHLLAVEPMSRSEREQLDEPGRLAAPPSRVRHGVRAEGDAEPAEQLDPKHRTFRHGKTILRRDHARDERAGDTRRHPPGMCGQPNHGTPAGRLPGSDARRQA